MNTNNNANNEALYSLLEYGRLADACEWAAQRADTLAMHSLALATASTIRPEAARPTTRPTARPTARPIISFTSILHTR